VVQWREGIKQIVGIPSPSSVRRRNALSMKLSYESRSADGLGDRAGTINDYASGDLEKIISS
jgi:hypothetical protein